MGRNQNLDEMDEDGNLWVDTDWGYIDLRIWCVECDENMEEKGIALDCPEDGVSYICPKCGHRIVVFNKNARVWR